MSWRNHPTMKAGAAPRKGMSKDGRIRRGFRRDKNEGPIVYRLRLAGWTVVELNGTPGLPDLLVAKDGWIRLLEVKGATGSLTPAQRRMHTSLELGGVKVHVVRTPEEALEAVAR